MDDFVVAVELVPNGGVIAVTVRLGEPHTVSLRTPLVGQDGTFYTAMDVVVNRLSRNGSPEPRA